MIEIVGSALYQWDTDRTVNAGIDIDHIHLSNPGDAYAVIMDGSTVTIPNYLLQSGKPVVAYAVKDGVTVESKTFPVHKRERPENYVYDEDRRNFIYELISDAQAATQGAEEAAGRANDAADRADQFAGDVDNLQKEVVDLRTDLNGDTYYSAGDAVRTATTVLNTHIQEVGNAVSELDEGFEPRVEKTVVENLENGGDIYNRVHALSVDVSEQSLYDAYLIENDENGEPSYHAERKDNPHKVTAEQIGAVSQEEFAGKVEDVVVTDLTGTGPIRSEVYSVAASASEEALELYELIREDESTPSGYSSNVVTKEQLGIETQALYDYVDQERDLVIERAVEQVFLDAYTKTEVDAKIAETNKELQELSDIVVGASFFVEHSTKTDANKTQNYFTVEDAETVGNKETETGKKYTFTVKSYSGKNLKNVTLYYSGKTGQAHKIISNTLVVGSSVTFEGDSSYPKLIVNTVTTTPEEATITFTLSEGTGSGENSILARLDNIENRLPNNATVPNVLVLGDSYSAIDGGKWINQLKTIVGIGEVVNLAVSSATMKDNYEDRDNYPYSDNPKKDDGRDNNKNTFGSQIEKLKRLIKGTTLYEGETKLRDGYAPDIIFIEGGTNDLVDNSTDSYVSQIYTVEHKYIKYNSNSANDPDADPKYIKVPTKLEETDRTTFAGAMRYLYGWLHNEFKNALIFFITPSGLQYMSGNTHKYLEKGDQIKYAASLLCTPVIDWGVNGRLSICDNVVKGTGTKDDPYTYADPGEYSIDSLHPNDDGARLLAMEVAKVLTSYNLAKYTQ